MIDYIQVKESLDKLTEEFNVYIGTSSNTNHPSVTVSTFEHSVYLEYDNHYKAIYLCDSNGSVLIKSNVNIDTFVTFAQSMFTVLNNQFN